MSPIWLRAFHNSKRVPTPNTAPVLVFGGNWNFGTISALFLLYLLMKVIYRKSFQNSKTGGTQALARVAGMEGFWRVGGLQDGCRACSGKYWARVNDARQRVSRYERLSHDRVSRWVLLGASTRGAKDREIRLVSRLAAGLILCGQYVQLSKLMVKK